MKHTLLDWMAGATVAIMLFLAFVSVSDIVTHVLRLVELARPFI